jgi:excisionase family DNA binding protein
MPKVQNAKSFSALSVVDVAELLGVTDRGVRKWIKEKGLPAKSDPRGFTLNWPDVLQWYVEYRLDENAGTGGTRRAGNAPEGSEEPPETFDQAILRKTKAEADLKELQLAREEAQVVAVADLQRVLAAANRSIQTQILALPAGLAPQLIGMDDRQQIYSLIDRNCRALLSNLASIDAVLESHAIHSAEDDV